MTPTMIRLSGIGLFLAFSLAVHATEEEVLFTRTCEKPPKHAGTQINATKMTKFMHGERVYYDCLDGYSRTKSYYRNKEKSYVDCLNGTWTRLTLSCIQEEVLFTRTCEKPPKRAGTQINATKMTKFMHGERVYYDCLDGYSRTKSYYRNKGKSYVDCLNGTWTRLTLSCSPSSGACERPASNNANVYLDSSGTQFPSGATVRYTCAVGYAHVGGSRYRTCSPGKGTWSPLEIRCEPKSCGSAGEIENGEYVYTGVEFGGMVTAACNEGYQLVGRATRTCLSEGWDGRTATCQAVHCDPPETNAEMTSIWRASYTYRQVIQYRCPQGTLVGQAHLWCTENGTWSAPPPACRGNLGRN
ncbi:hypothetical protein NHX12_013553 [Muraenolepis orangiensis]|uniref:Sushi domain-containing protein n=1 Tax=Muraenolepis orangiensis TaxID=630683 RepID=A0A9Q0DGL1_9TELE|nr:hypothetical protein NHX12_013553 [Muraenolepis orangiensis]